MRNEIVSLLQDYTKSASQKVLQTNDIKRLTLLDTAKELSVRAQSIKDEFLICRMVLANKTLLTKLCENYQLKALLFKVNKSLLKPKTYGHNTIYFTLEQ
jgi:hypothetical protein